MCGNSKHIHISQFSIGLEMKIMQDARAEMKCAFFYASS